MLIFITGPSGLAYQFSVAERYVSGQALVLSRGEARALNLMRSENVTRNKAKRVKRAEQVSPRGVIEDCELVAIQGEIDEYDGRYQFANEVEPSARMGDIDREAIEVAKTLGLHHTHEDCREEARRRLLAKKNVARDALEGL